MIVLSSNAFSVDDQTADVLSYLSSAPLNADESDKYAGTMARFVAEFPEYNSLTWSGSWVDTEASGVDPEYMSWVRDWIEANTDVTWFEGEPVIFEESDDTGEDF